MNLELQNKHVLICGGTKGIGLACAEAFLAEGAIVTVVGRYQCNIDSAKTILQPSSSVTFYRCDVSVVEEVDKMIDELPAIDVLVNCAGSAPKFTTLNLTPVVWEQAMTRKLFAYTNVIDLVIRKMAIIGSGSIVNVIGIGGKIPAKDHLTGGAANSALMLATVGYANEYSPYGIRVNGVNPASVDTPRLNEMFDLQAKWKNTSSEIIKASTKATFPNCEMVDIKTVANTVVFLSSNAAKSINGTIVTIDNARSPMI